MKAQVAEEPRVREEYLKKLDRIRKDKFIKVRFSLFLKLCDTRV